MPAPEISGCQSTALKQTLDFAGEARIAGVISGQPGGLLPDQFRHQLHLARRIGLRLPLTPVGVPERRSAPNGAEPGAIQNVERLGTKLQVRPFLNAEDPR